METAEISIHQLKVFNFVKNSEGWVSSKEVAEATGVAGRTARMHCLNFVKAGIFDQAEVHPSHRYRLSTLASKRNLSFINRLEQAEEILNA